MDITDPVSKGGLFGLERDNIIKETIRIYLVYSLSRNVTTNLYLQIRSNERRRLI